MKANPVSPAFGKFATSSPRTFAPERVRLTGSEVFSPNGRVRGLRLEVTEGLLWVTQAGDTTDYLLGPGECFAATREGRLVAQTVTPTARFIFTAIHA